LHLAGAQIFGNAMDPTAGRLRFLPVEQPGHAPSMLALNEDVLALLIR
jgi:hypothetical protein